MDLKFNTILIFVVLTDFVIRKEIQMEILKKRELLNMQKWEII